MNSEFDRIRRQGRRWAGAACVASAVVFAAAAALLFTQALTIVLSQSRLGKELRYWLAPTEEVQP